MGDLRLHSKGIGHFLGVGHDELRCIERGIDIFWGIYGCVERGLDIFWGSAMMRCVERGMDIFWGVYGALWAATHALWALGAVICHTPLHLPETDSFDLKASETNGCFVLSLAFGKL